MRIGIFGLGRMGGDMARRLLKDEHQVVGWDPDTAAVNAASADGIIPAQSIEDAFKALDSPRVCWVMAPAGEASEKTLKALAALLEKGDVLVDGANSDWRDTARRADDFRKMAFEFVDAGVSGGIHGLKRGYCLMVGGAKPAFDVIEPVLKSLAPENGYMHVGPSGAGHYAKMIHNAVEYGMMQSIAEGIQHLKVVKSAGQVNDVAALVRLWTHGSVIQSWLLELAADALAKDGELSAFEGRVGRSGEGDWAAREAKALNVAMPALQAALDSRTKSINNPSFAGKVLSAMRAGFGGHKEK